MIPTDCALRVRVIHQALACCCGLVRELSLVLPRAGHSPLRAQHSLQADVRWARQRYYSSVVQPSAVSQVHQWVLPKKVVA